MFPPKQCSCGQPASGSSAPGSSASLLHCGVNRWAHLSWERSCLVGWPWIQPNLRGSTHQKRESRSGDSDKFTSLLKSGFCLHVRDSSSLWKNLSVSLSFTYLVLTELPGAKYWVSKGPQAMVLALEQPTVMGRRHAHKWAPLKQRRSADTDKHCVVLLVCSVRNSQLRRVKDLGIYQGLLDEGQWGITNGCKL